MSITKHYIMNNQETDRSGVNEIIDEKTLMVRVLGSLFAPNFPYHYLTGCFCLAGALLTGVWRR